MHGVPPPLGQDSVHVWTRRALRNRPTALVITHISATKPGNLARVIVIARARWLKKSGQTSRPSSRRKSSVCSSRMSTILGDPPNVPSWPEVRVRTNRRKAALKTPTSSRRQIHRPGAIGQKPILARHCPVLLQIAITPSDLITGQIAQLQNATCLSVGSVTGRS